MKQLYLITLCITLCFCGFGNAQTDQNKAFQDVSVFLATKQFDRAKKHIDTDLLQSKNEADQILGYASLVYYYSTLQAEQNDKEQINALERLRNLTEDSDNPRYKAYAAFGETAYYQNLQKKFLFVEAFNKSLNILTKYKDENFLIATLYFRKNEFAAQLVDRNLDYESFISSLDYAAKSKNNVYITLSYNDMAAYYLTQMQKTNNPEDLLKGDQYCQELYKHSLTIEDQATRDATYLNYYINAGGIRCLQKKYDEAKAFLNKGLTDKYTNNPQYTYFVCLIYETLGIVSYYDQKNSEAFDYFLKAYSYKDNPKVTATLKLAVLQNLSFMCQSMGNYQEAISYENERQALLEQEHKNNAQTLETFYQLEQKRSLLEEKNNALNKERYFYIGIAIASFLGIVFLIYLINYRKKLNEEKQNLLQEEQLRLIAEQELMALKQEQLQKKHLAAELQLSHKNSILTSIKEKSKEQAKNEIHKLLKDDESLGSVVSNLQQTLLEISPAFFQRLSEISQNKLSPLEVKYAAFMYIRMDNQQIANYLKADLNAVRVAKHRLKKKLNLSKDESLEDFIQNIKTEGN